MQHGNNAWPGELACPGFRDTQLVYFQEMWELARRLNDLVAISLHLPKDTFKGNHWTNLKELLMSF